MKEICTPKSRKAAEEMAATIMLYIKGNFAKHISGQLVWSEKMRQYFTWGAHAHTLIGSKCGCYGLQFKVNGMLFKGRVRIYYNPCTDYFDVELVKARKEELVKSFEDIDFLQLHNVCHRNIERTDDVEV